MTRIGKRVLYKFNEGDVEFIDALRKTDGGVNPANVGEQYPGVIVGDWVGHEDACVNLSVTLDGCVLPMWKTSVFKGSEPGQWQYID